MVNDRRLMDMEITGLGIQEEKKGLVFNLIDRRDKLAAGEWDAYILDEGFTARQLEGLKEIIDDNKLYQKSRDMLRFFSAIEHLGVMEYVKYDARIVRGLDYYTGIVFEAKDTGETGRAILGGGHYDNLVEDVGGDPLPGVGFAMGDVVLPIILEQQGKLPQLDLFPAKVMVTIFNEETKAYSHAISSTLRQNGINTIIYPDAVKLSRQFKYSDRTGVRFVIVAGPEELQADKLQVKNLTSGEQKSMDLQQAIEWISAELDDA